MSSEANQTEIDFLKFLNEDFLMETLETIDEKETHMDKASTPVIIQQYLTNELTPRISQEPDFDPNLFELQEMLSTSPNSDENAGILDMSLDNIPLIEDSAEDLILPQKKTKLTIVKAPAEVQNDPMLENVPNVKLSGKTIRFIKRASKVNNRLILTPMSVTEYSTPVRRPPLRTVQPIIKYSAPENDENRDNERVGDDRAAKALHKRKQSFKLSREDVVMFYSDEEEDGAKNARQREKVQEANVEQEPEVVEIIPAKMSEIFKTPEKEAEGSASKTKKSRRKVKELSKCPACEKEFKNLLLHRCKKAMVKPIQYKIIRPSQVPLNLKCNNCKEKFSKYDELNDHQASVHAHLICKQCKYVAKGVNGLNAHMNTCSGNKVSGIFTIKKMAGNIRAVVKNKKIKK